MLFVQSVVVEVGGCTGSRAPSLPREQPITTHDAVPPPLLPGCRVQGAGCRVPGAGFRVQGSGFRGQGRRGPKI